MSKNAGFTLIELLVVVLIIGVLAAVALPQYTAAVDKARVTGFIFPKLKAVCQAQQAYILANGSMTHDFTDLDVDITSGCRIISQGSNTNNLLDCNARGTRFNFYMTRGNGNVASHYKQVGFDVFPENPTCQILCRVNGVTPAAKEEAHRFCARFGTRESPTSLYYRI